MGRPRQVSDEQILAQMRREVLSEGPAVSLEQVAKPLCVSVPALLKRFGSRQKLMLAALKPPDSPEWIDQVDKGPDERPLRTQLLDMFTRLFAFMESSVPCLAALRESGIPVRDAFSRSNGPTRGLKAIQRWLAVARKRGIVTAPEADSAAYAIIGSLQTRVFYNYLLKARISDRERRQYLEELSRIFTRALSP